MDKVMSLLSLSRKAGKLTVGTEEGQAFFCTPVILDNTVRYIESVAQAQQQKETAGDGVYVNQ